MKISTKVLLINMVLLVVIGASLFFMRYQIDLARGAIQDQARVIENSKKVKLVADNFNDLKYWLTDLEVTWFESSEAKVDEVQNKLEIALKNMASFAPDVAKKISGTAETLSEGALDAVDKYMAEDRKSGNKLVEESRMHMMHVQKMLEPLLNNLSDQTATAAVTVLERADAAGNAALALIGIAVILMLAITGVISFIVARPIRTLTEAMSQLADGDTSVELSGKSRRDEIGDMIKAVKVFRDNAIERKRLEIETEEHRVAAEAEKERQRQTELETERKERKAEEQRIKEQEEFDRKQLESEEKQRLELAAKDRESKELAAKEKAEEETKKRRLLNLMAGNFEAKVGSVVEEVSGASKDMNSSAGSLAETADETFKEAERANKAVELMSGNVQTVASAAEQLTSSIQEISRQVSESSQLASSAVDEARQSHETVQSLVTSAKTIGEVVSLITDIASQTNLLALNATIEAARAGEAGKGFAVVASEVGNLANQTSSATEQIGRQIEDIQSKTEQAAKAIDGIGSIIQSLDANATAIASAIEEQSAATGEIARNVDEAATGANEVSNNIKTVTTAANMTGKSAAEISAATDQMSKQTEVMRTEVKSFIEQIRIDSLDLGIEKVDEDHHKLLEWVEDIVEEGRSEADVLKILDELMDYTKYHFEREEKVMQICGYPDSHSHIQSHRELTSDLERLAAELKSSPTRKLFREFHDFLRDWLINHILEVDRAVLPFIEGKEKMIDEALKEENLAA